MIGKKIENIIVKEIENFYDEYKKENFEDEDDEGTVESELVQKLIAHFSMDKKKQKKSTTPTEDRCLAITSKKTQCTSKRVEGNLCKIHFKKGTTHGIIGEVDSSEEEKPKKSAAKKAEKACEYMFQRGKQAGMKCGKKPVNEGETFCKQHSVSKNELETLKEDSYPKKETVSDSGSESDDTVKKSPLKNKGKQLSKETVSDSGSDSDDN